MKKYILIMIAVFLTGCTVARQNISTNTSNFPSAYKPEFPSYGVVSEINEGIEWKIAEGSWKMKMETELWGRQADNAYYSIKENQEIIISWDTEINNNNYLIRIANDDMEGVIKYSLQSGNIEFESMSEFGENIESGTKEFVDLLKEDIGDVFKANFKNLGKTLKSGDEIFDGGSFNNILLKMREEFQKIAPGVKINYEKPSVIIRGFGIFNDQKVIVADFKGWLRFHEGSHGMTIMIGGYHLYHPETFIQLKNETAMHMVFNLPPEVMEKEELESQKIVLKGETFDIQVHNLIM